MQPNQNALECVSECWPRT